MSVSEFISENSVGWPGAGYIKRLNLNVMKTQLKKIY